MRTVASPVTITFGKLAATIVQTLGEGYRLPIPGVYADLESEQQFETVMAFQW